MSCRCAISTEWKIPFQRWWNSAKNMLKLKKTYGFRIVSGLKFQVTASFRNAESQAVPVSRRFPTTDTCWNLAIPNSFSMRNLFRIWRMYSYRNWIFLKRHLNIMETREYYLYWNSLKHDLAEWHRKEVIFEWSCII